MYHLFSYIQRRKVKVSARKQNRDHDTITPAKSSLSVFPSCSRMLLTPQTSSVKRKLPKPIFTGKKPKLEASTPSSMRNSKYDCPLLLFVSQKYSK